MNSKIYSHETLIGTANLKIGDESMGCVYGEFNPTDAYFEIVQKQIWKFWDKENYFPWNDLRLNVQLENGYFLYPIGGITIDDIEELPDEPLRIDIAGLYRHVLDDYFERDNKDMFTELP